MKLNAAKNSGYSNVNDDASYGPKFDPNIKLLQWYALYPQLEETYGIATPWVGTENGPITFFESPVSTTNSISVSKNDETGSFRLSYSNYDAIGLLPNSTQDKNTFSIAGFLEWEENLKFFDTYDKVEEWQLDFPTVYGSAKNNLKM